MQGAPPCSVGVQHGADVMHTAQAPLFASHMSRLSLLTALPSERASGDGHRVSFAPSHEDDGSLLSGCDLIFTSYFEL